MVTRFRFELPRAGPFGPGPKAVNIFFAEAARMIPGTQELKNSGTQELRNSGTQELGNSGTRELANSGTQELRVS